MAVTTMHVARLSAVTIVFVGLFAWTADAQLEPAVSERADGTAEVTIDGRQLLVPAPVAEAVSAAVRDNANDLEALRKAVSAIIDDHAGQPDTADLAIAIGALALFHAPPNSAVIDAIIRAVLTANPAVLTGTLLAALPALTSNPRSLGVAQEKLAQLAATIENPAQVSPVE